MLEKHTKVLSQTMLFRDFTQLELEEAFQNLHTSIVTYGKNDILAIEGDPCTSIGIVLDGNAEIQKLYETGKVITVDTLRLSDIFGEVIIFSDMRNYPSSIISTTKSEIMFISKSDIMALCAKYNKFLNNFMGLLSNKILKLNNKIRTMSYKSIKQRIAAIIIEEYQKQNSKKLILPYSRKAMAEQLGIPRPSLSREFMNLQNEGIIVFEKNDLEILDIDALNDVFF